MDIKRNDESGREYIYLTQESDLEGVSEEIIQNEIIQNEIIDDPQIQKIVLDAYFNKINILTREERFEDLVAFFDEIIDRFTKNIPPNNDFENLLLDSFFNKAVLLSNLNRFDKSVEAYETFIDFYRDTDKDHIKVYLGNAVFGRGYALNMLGDIPNAMKAYDDLLKMHKNTSDIELQISVARAWTNKAKIYSQQGEIDKAFENYDLILEYYSNSSNIKLLEQVIMAFYFKASLFYNLKNDYKNALKLLDELLHRFVAGSANIINIWIGRAFQFKAIVLIKLERYPEAINTYQNLLWNFKESVSSEIQSIIADCYSQMTSIFIENHYSEHDIIRLTDEIISHYENSTQQKFHELVAQAYFNKAAALLNLGEKPAAKNTYETLIKQYGKYDNEFIKELLIKTQSTIDTHFQ